MIELSLTRGYTAILDDEDADLSKFKWRAHVDKECRGVYAVREVTDKTRKNGRRTERLHRIILSRKLERELLQTEEVDHINTNSLDNRRSNLRLVTRSQNLQNTPRRRDNTSGYKGVVYHKASGKWHAVIYAQGKRISLKYHNTLEEAYEAYKSAAIKYFGEFARI